jgi:glucan phosphoethanolaminetransferase (alkaline phosphatase superfamily)
MDAITLAITIGALIVLVVVFFALRNRQTAGKMLQQNVGVVPLMLQKATQMKVTRLQQATQDDIEANQKLVKIVAAYKNNQLTMDEYSQKLDAMINRLEIDL